MRDKREPARASKVVAKEMNADAAFAHSLAEHQRIFQQLELLSLIVIEIASSMLSVLLRGGKVLWCGNGGSAADAQHLAAELVGRFQRERRGLSSIALTTDSSVLTSIANDYGFSAVFRRQVEALGQPGDMLVGISTSGNSENVCAALEEARALGLLTAAMTGGTGGRMATLADMVLCIPSSTTARVQEAHIFCGHAICDIVEAAMQQREREDAERSDVEHQLASVSTKQGGD